MLRLSFIILLTISLYAQSPHGEHFDIDCGECHNTTGWKIVPYEIKFNHDITSFSLTGQHKNVECRQCHSALNFSDSKSECMDCHKDVHQNTVGQDCARCHQTSSWLVTNLTQLHENERFPLLGKHKTARCEDCHMSFNDLRFSPLNITCFDCHSKEYYSTKTPDHVIAGFSTECSECHSVAGFAWKAGTLNHDFFPLTGKHSIADCFDCHQGNSFTGLSKQCYSCHGSDFEIAVNPDHKQAGFSIECENCHTINGWSPASFNHSVTQFPLTGAHLEVQCSGCHSGGYNNIATLCYSCHTDEYNNSLDPNHAAAGFPTECESCHNTNGWKPAAFDHDQKYFPIYSGEHRGKWENCSSCHTQQNNFAVFSCIDCHEHNKAETDDEHKEVQGYVFASADCFACHPNGSGEGSVNHSLTNFPLTGAHLTANCSDCHQGGYTNTSINCIDCHNQDYQLTTNPPHKTLTLSTDCGGCHSTQPGWKNASFAVHDNFYQLTGAHSAISNNCADCHKGTYTNTPENCYGCHQNDFTSSVNPNHVNAGISNKCEECHTTTAWNTTTFQHISTGFELTGAHKPIQCSSCHKGTTTGLVGSCVSCHQAKYDTAPEHKAQSYPQNCEMCHNTTIWTQTDFNHASTNFPLTGAHQNTNCSDCHQGGYTNTPMNCVDCHNQDFQNSVNPSHTTLALSTDCISCHTTTPGWKPASFIIHNTFYELLGAHASISNDCAGCHNGNYNNTPNTCYGCHTADFNNVTDPSHSAAGFSTDCIPCHNQTSWKPSTFNHDGQYFPIYSGKHRGKWDKCSDCHAQQNNFTLFSCTDCHEHNKTETDDDHKDVQGYVYISTECYDCHPNGDEGRMQGLIQ